MTAALILALALLAGPLDAALPQERPDEPAAGVPAEPVDPPRPGGQLADGTAEAPTASSTPGAEEEDAIAPPRTVAEATAVDLDDLEEQLRELPVEGVEQHRVAWQALAQEVQDAWRRASSGRVAPEVSAAALAVDRDALVRGLTRVTQVLIQRGADPGESEAWVEDLVEADLRDSDSPRTVPRTPAAGEALPLEVLRSSLRPLTLAQAERELAGWVDLLRVQSLAVRNLEVAALESEDADDIDRFNAAGVELRADRQHLIQRVEVVVDAVEEKGGDVDEVRAYLDSVEAPPPVTQWRAALSVARAWITSADGGGALALKILRAVAVFVAAWFLAGLLAKLAEKGMGRIHKASGLLRTFVVQSTRRLALLLGLLIALSQLGLDMTPMLAAIGAAGVVIGLALQNTLSNFASGLLIMTNRPFDVGDFVSTGGVDGLVRSMTLLTTCIETFDGRTVYIPNNKVFGDTITNVSASPRRRVELVFGVAYEDDFRRAQELLREIVGAHEKVQSDPEPVVRLAELGDSSVNFAVWAWVRNEDFLAVRWDLIETVKDRFDAEGITIPFPQRDVHLIPAPADASPTAASVDARAPEEPAATR